ncbi:hypothetical protein NGRA_0510 [Nosema granulosis]|uniref:Uncharacterized protein n=1 Tax=Nosema granulosis TaxID=83296 RepID=A0A9P6H1V9_9MICR|nr:hypothetical protein NGRA_0510 [Nosema granulosis]
MRNILFYVLFALGNPCFYDSSLSLIIETSLIDSIISLYKPINRISIDNNDYTGAQHPVVFVIFYPLYKRIHLCIDEKSRKLETFVYYNDKINDVLSTNEDLEKFAFWGSKQIETTLNNLQSDMKFDICFTIRRNEDKKDSKYTDDNVIEFFSKKIVDILKSGLSQINDVKYHSEYLETYIATKNNLMNNNLKTEFISFKVENYKFGIFVQDNFYKKVEKKIYEIIRDIENRNARYIETTYLKNIDVIHNSDNDNDLFILTVFNSIKGGFVRCKQTEVQKQILIRIIKYLDNKKDLHLFINDFFKDESASSQYLEKLKVGIADFEIEKKKELEKIGACGVKYFEIEKKLLFYINVLSGNRHDLISYKFIGKILFFFSLNIETLIKIVSSGDRNPNKENLTLREYIYTEALKYWTQWLKNFFKCINLKNKSTKKLNMPTEITIFKYLNQKCVTFAAKYNSPYHFISRALYNKAKQYYSQPSSIKS